VASGFVQQKISDFGEMMTKELAVSIQRKTVESRLVRLEDFQCFDCEFHIADVLNMRPALAPYLISTDTALTQIVPAIDRDTLKEMDKMGSSALGDVSFAIDGVTANSRSYLLFTKMMGCITQFVGMTQLGSNVHVTSAEVVETARRITEEIRRVGVNVPGAVPRQVASVAVDNAGFSMAAQLKEELAKSEVSKKCLVVRDPSHCEDLLSKDLASHDFVLWSQ